MEDGREIMIREIMAMIEKMTPKQREVYMEVVRDMYGEIPGNKGKNADKKAG